MAFLQISTGAFMIKEAAMILSLFFKKDLVVSLLVVMTVHPAMARTRPSHPNRNFAEQVNEEMKRIL